MARDSAGLAGARTSIAKAVLSSMVADLRAGCLSLMRRQGGRNAWIRARHVAPPSGRSMRSPRRRLCAVNKRLNKSWKFQLGTAARQVNTNSLSRSIVFTIQPCAACGRPPHQGKSRYHMRPCSLENAVHKNAYSSCAVSASFVQLLPPRRRSRKIILRPRRHSRPKPHAGPATGTGVRGPKKQLQVSTGGGGPGPCGRPITRPAKSLYGAPRSALSPPQFRCWAPLIGDPLATFMGRPGSARALGRWERCGM